MENALLEEFNVRAHLNAYWLRPESALWDSIAARYISEELTDRKNILEVGIGNGFFSFLMLGGRFKPEFDWFYSVNMDGFWEDEDTFDCDVGVPIGDYIESMPSVRLKVGVDHKQSLLKQAARLGFVDELVEQDCNLALSIQTNIDTVYSNILYWLDDPVQSLHEIGEILPSGGEFVTVFPNSEFYRSCSSYTGKDVLSKLINRGRAKCFMWCMDMPEFEQEIAKRGVFDIESSRRFLSPQTLKIWDVGLRPLSIPLIKMANSLGSDKRLEIKEEWCETLMRFFVPLLENELDSSEALGGLNLVRLVKR